jgi:hypothetical protein
LKDEQELYDFIDDYLKGDSHADLPQVEGMDFEELSQEIAYQKVLKDAVVLNRLSQLSETIHKIDQQAQFKKKAVKYTVLATLLAVLVSAGFFIYSTKKTSHTSEHTPRPVAVRSPASKTEAETLPKPRTDQTIVANNIREAEDTKEQTDKPTGGQEAPIVTPSEKEVQHHSLPAVSEQSSDKTPLADRTSSPNVVDCKQVKIKANYTFENPCVGQNNGQISIEEISGGTKPYRFSIDHGKSFVDEADFKALNSGHYQLLVKDAQDCVSEVIAQVSLTEASCETKAAQSYVFNPTKESWEIPTQQEYAGTVEIYNNRGILVYRANFNKFETLNWNGSSPQGEQTSPGVYIYRIQYENSTSEKGSVSIVY